MGNGVNEMKKHYNLYYLLLEDKRQNPMPEVKRIGVRENLQKIFRKNKTISKPYPP